MSQYTSAEIGTSFHKYIEDFLKLEYTQFIEQNQEEQKQETQSINQQQNTQPQIQQSNFPVSFDKEFFKENYQNDHKLNVEDYLAMKYELNKFQEGEYIKKLENMILRIVKYFQGSYFQKFKAQQQYQRYVNSGSDSVQMLVEQSINGVYGCIFDLAFIQGDNIVVVDWKYSDRDDSAEKNQKYKDNIRKEKFKFYKYISISLKPDQLGQILQQYEFQPTEKDNISLEVSNLVQEEINKRFQKVQVDILNMYNNDKSKYENMKMLDFLQEFNLEPLSDLDYKYELKSYYNNPIEDYKENIEKGEWDSQFINQELSIYNVDLVADLKIIKLRENILHKRVQIEQYYEQIYKENKKVWQSIEKHILKLNSEDSLIKLITILEESDKICELSNDDDYFMVNCWDYRYIKDLKEELYLGKLDRSLFQYLKKEIIYKRNTIQIRNNIPFLKIIKHRSEQIKYLINNDKIKLEFIEKRKRHINLSIPLLELIQKSGIEFPLIEADYTYVMQEFRKGQKVEDFIEDLKQGKLDEELLIIGIKKIKNVFREWVEYYDFVMLTKLIHNRLCDITNQQVFKKVQETIEEKMKKNDDLYEFSDIKKITEQISVNWEVEMEYLNLKSELDFDSINDGLRKDEKKPIKSVFHYPELKNPQDMSIIDINVQNNTYEEVKNIYGWKTIPILLNIQKKKDQDFIQNEKIQSYQKQTIDIEERLQMKNYPKNLLHVWDFVLIYGDNYNLLDQDLTYIFQNDIPLETENVQKIQKNKSILDVKEQLFKENLDDFLVFLAMKSLEELETLTNTDFIPYIKLIKFRQREIQKKYEKEVLYSYQKKKLGKEIKKKQFGDQQVEDLLDKIEDLGIKPMGYIREKDYKMKGSFLKNQEIYYSWPENREMKMIRNFKQMKIKDLYQSEDLKGNDVIIVLKLILQESKNNND